MLAQLATLKTRLGLSDTTDDALLTSWLQWASTWFEQETNRQFARTEGELYEFGADRVEISVPRYPIEAVIAFDLYDPSPGIWRPQSGVAYTPLLSAGVISLEGPIGGSRERARVLYTGGYVLPGATVEDGQTALPTAIEQACIEQVAFWYQQRHRLGMTSVSGAGGSSATQPDLDLLPSVRATLQPYRRLASF